jgi:hypothetical protein
MIERDLSVEALTRAHLAGTEEVLEFFRQLRKLGFQGASDQANMLILGKLLALAKNGEEEAQVRMGSLHLIGGFALARPELINSHLQSELSKIASEIGRYPMRPGQVSVSKAAFSALANCRFKGLE